jgi:cysteine-rich repeat protein
VIDWSVVVVRRFLPAVLCLVAGGCVVGVNDVEKPATDGGSGAGGASGSGSSGGASGGGTGGSSGGTTGGTGGATNGGTGGVSGSGTGGVTQGGTGSTSTGGTGGVATDTCGDKVLATGEECDDGNATPGDGCSDTCEVECSESLGEYLLPNKHCYRGVKDLMSWTAAGTVCAAWHGHLISISGDDEVDMSHKLADSVGTPAWIGLGDQLLEGKYTWVDSTPYLLMKWEPGEPNDVAHYENCVVLAGNSAGTSYSWYDETCDSAFRPICERAAGVP